MPLLVVLSTLAHAGDCPRVGADALSRQLDQAERSYQSLDEPAFFAAMEAGEGLLACLSEPIPPALATRYHLLRALHDYAKAGAADAAASLAVVRWDDPTATLPPGLIPATHPLGELFLAQDPQAVELEALPPLTTGSWLLDGLARHDRPIGLPLVVQLMDTQDVLRTAYVEPGGTFPERPVVTVQPRSRKGARIAFGVGIGVGAVASAALLLAASGTETELLTTYDPDQSLPDLEARRSTVTGLSAGDIAAGGVAVLSAGGLALTWVVP